MSMNLTFKRYASDIVARERLDKFFGYYMTRHNLRPLVYRPKNANILLSMDLKDSKTKDQVKPREPFKPIAKTVLHEYINSIGKPKKDEANELYNWYRDWTSVSVRKREVFNYITSSHLQDILFKAFFQTGAYSHLLSSMYSNYSKFEKCDNLAAYDIDRFFNTILTCNLHRNKLMRFNDPQISLKKIDIAFKKSTGTDQFGLTRLLIQELGQQLNFPPDELISKYKLSSEINLPKLDDPAKALKFHLENKGTYIITRTLAEFSNGTLDPNIEEFNKNYQSIAKTLNINEDVYDTYKETANEIWNDKANSTKTEEPKVTVEELEKN